MGYKEGQIFFNVLLTNWQGEEDVKEYESSWTHCGKKEMSFFRSFCRKPQPFIVFLLNVLCLGRQS
jgi:hypothetical protein